MARRSLKPQLNQIRTWVRQGRTDAWIAHQLDVSVKDISAFKRDHDLAPAEAEGGNGYDADEPDLRAEDDALVAAALEAEEDEPEPEEDGEGDSAEEEDRDEDRGDQDDDGEDRPRSRRRRGRRGGRGRSSGGGRGGRKALEGTFDHGEEGYGLWLDPSIQDDPVYAEHWAGHRQVAVAVEPDRIVISRVGEDQGGEE